MPAADRGFSTPSFHAGGRGPAPVTLGAHLRARATSWHSSKTAQRGGARVAELPQPPLNSPALKCRKGAPTTLKPGSEIKKRISRNQTKKGKWLYKADALLYITHMLQNKPTCSGFNTLNNICKQKSVQCKKTSI